MKNADKPAMPVTIEMDVIAWQQAKAAGENVNSVTTHPGLTKREHFASIAMQGMFANKGYVVADDHTLDMIKVCSYRIADLMLEET